jgi:hypothetical protein
MRESFPLPLPDLPIEIGKRKLESGQVCSLVGS